MPTDISTRPWAIYILVLEKSDCRPKLSVGSGTDRFSGVAKRWASYDKGMALPSGLKEFLPQGWKVTHRGLIAWCQRPSYQDIGSVRFFFLLLETLFGGLLYAMKSTTVDYGFPSLCPWRLEDLPYDGLCSHAAMFERILPARSLQKPKP